MGLVNTGDILGEANRAGYCVGAFNAVDLVTMEAIACAADHQQAPVIIQTSPAIVKRLGASLLVAMARNVADKLIVPIGLHLDHGTDLRMIQECIENGYTSVMIDASRYSFHENVRITRSVVEQAHRHGVAVEGEIGVMAGVEDDLVVSQSQAIYTTADEAIAFQAQTGVDFLAVAIGTAHGFYKVAPRLDIDVLRSIRAQVRFPIVIHGGTGLGFDVIRKLTAAGASKLNLSTQLKKTYIDSLYEHIKAHPQEYNPLALFDAARQELVALVSTYIELLGGVGRAAGAGELQTNRKEALSDNPSSR